MFNNCNALKHIKCRKVFKDWCISKNILPAAMKDGGSGTWEIID